MLFLFFLIPLISAYENHGQVYLLVSTSSKLYAMKIPDVHTVVRSSQRSYYDDLSNYELIYEQKNLVHNWITDAFYVKSENLIYVNVYDSSSSSSDIFTLKYNRVSNQWEKNILYKDQNNCLGIAYNEEKKELYWTSGKSVMSGSSQVQNSKTLYNLDLAKKLLYLKYDSITNNLYVSTLTYVYECPLSGETDCRVIVRDLVSARGLYIDSPNRALYVVDHKKRLIKRTILGLHNSESEVQTILNAETQSDLGDVFYLTLFKNYVIWTEFSGKIKIANLHDLSTYKLLFSTNEYTYSVNLMDNSTTMYSSISYRQTTTAPATTNIPTTTTTTTSTTTTITTPTTTSTSTTTTGILTTETTELSKTTSSIASEFDIQMEEDDEEVPIFSQTSTLVSTSSPIDNKIVHKLLKSSVTKTSTVSIESSSLTLARSSPRLNAALYIVVCLLCFSLIINIVLLYVTKMKQKRDSKLVIQHEIRNDLITAQNSEDTSSTEQNDCSINLINTISSNENEH